MSVQTINRLTEFRRLLRRVAEDVAPEVEWRAMTGQTAFQEVELDEQSFTLTGIVGPVTKENEDFLDELLDSHGQHSIRLAIESDRFLAGATDLRVISSSGVRHYPHQEEQQLYIGAEWKIKALFE